MKKMINIGYTNTSFIENDIFVQIKKENNFNHKTNYDELIQFEFIPKLIENTNTTLKWELINGKMLVEKNDEDLIRLAHILKKLHNSNAKFAKFNIKKRIDCYRKIMNQKGIQIDIINKLYKKINLILKNMDKTTPVHGDLFETNIMKDENNNIFIIDWEYSHLGDKHFELAYFVEAHKLSKEQEELFLKEYGNYDPYILKKHRVLVNYLTVLWLHSNETMFFSDKNCLNRLQELYDEGF